MTSATSTAAATTGARQVRQKRATTRGVSALMYASQQGDVSRVRKIIKEQSDSLQARDRTGKSALHYTCTSDRTTSAQAADLLVMAAPDLVESHDEDGFTPLHLAVIAGNISLVTFLLANKADVNAVDNEKHTVVHWATVCGETVALRSVLAAGAPVSTPDVHGGYPLHYAAQMCGGDKDPTLGLQVLQTLLTHSDIQVTVQDGDGRQPLLWAASAGSAKAVLAIIRAGASVEAPDKDGLTALHCAASRGHTDCIDTLLTLCGASPDVIDSNGCTALHYAVTLGHADATALLLAHGADPNRQDRKGRSPAHCGCAKGQFETVKMIGAHGANLWLRNARGDLPLHEAAASGRRDLVRWLLDMRPSQVNARNNDGRCPLHLAALNDNADMCKILLDAGAQINPILRTSKNTFMTPLDCALQRGFRSTAKYLQLQGGVPASRLGDMRHGQIHSNISSGVNLQIRDDVTFWGDTSSDSERENGGNYKADRKIQRKKLSHKYDKKRASLSGSDLENNKLLIGKMESGRVKSKLSEKNRRGKPGGGNDSAASIDYSKRVGSKKSPAGRFDYTNEIIINGKTEINIHQSKQINIGQEEVEEKSERIITVAKDVTETEKRPKSAKPAKARDKSALSVKNGESATRKQKTSARQTESRQGSSKKLEVDVEKTTQEVIKEKIEEERKSREEKKTLADQQSIMSNTSEDIAEAKSVVVEADLHEPPKTKEEKENRLEDESVQNRIASEKEVVSKELNETKEQIADDQNKMHAHEQTTKTVVRDSIQEHLVKESVQESTEEKKEEETDKMEENNAVQGNHEVEEKILKTDKMEENNLLQDKHEVEEKFLTESAVVTENLLESQTNEQTLLPNIEETKIVKVEEKIIDNIEGHLENNEDISITIENLKTAEKPEAENDVVKTDIKDEDKSQTVIEDELRRSEEIGAIHKVVIDEPSEDETKAGESTVEITEPVTAEVKSSSKDLQSDVEKIITKEKKELEFDEKKDAKRQKSGKTREETVVTENEVSIQPESTAKEDKVNEISEKNGNDIQDSGAGKQERKKRASKKESKTKNSTQVEQELKKVEKTLEKDNKSSKVKEGRRRRKERGRASKRVKSKHKESLETTNADIKHVKLPGGELVANEKTDEGERIIDKEKRKDESEPEDSEDKAPAYEIIYKTLPEGENVDQSEESSSDLESDTSGSSSSVTMKDHKSFRVLDEKEAKELNNLKKQTETKKSKRVKSPIKKQRSRSEENKYSAINKERDKVKRSRIPTLLGRKHLSKSDRYLNGEERKSRTGLDSRIPSLPDINNVKDQSRCESNMSAPLLASVYSDNERGSASDLEESRSSAVRKKKVKRRPKTRERDARSAGSDYESSNVIDSGFEPSPRSSKIPKWKNMSGRGVNMTSVTQSIQTNIRRYHLERKIFQNLLDLKRLQIRAGQHNEAILVKRAIDTYHQSCASTVGAGRYIPEDYTFKSFEKFLYLALRKLQRNGADHLKGLPESPANPLLCTQSTHRCIHATHAYTGIPCAAYLPKMDHHSIPKIGFNSTECKPGTAFLPTINSNKKAVTLELCHGNDKQVISLPADRLDQNKRYYVTFTVKGSEPTALEKEEEEEATGHIHSKSD